MEFKFRNVNVAFRSLVAGIHHKDIPTIRSESRNGPVLRIPEPVTITFTNPRERVLFNRGRDANCFMHLFEALWMLAGRRDVNPLAYYTENVRQYSDDGKVFHSAYGYRWRRHFTYDQLDLIVDELRKNPTSRRIVLQMWDANTMPDNREPEASDLCGDLEVAMVGGKDVSCNTHAYFDIVDGKLNMTVCNRSNDLVWGLLGANVVHFSFLLEYLACRIGVEVGLQHHFTNNLHIYTESNSGFHPEKWLEGRLSESSYADNVEDQTVNGGVIRAPMLLTDTNRGELFDKEVKTFIDDVENVWETPWLNYIAQPMCMAFRKHKERDYAGAREWMARVVAEDWYEAGIQWLIKRELNWKAKQNVSATDVYQKCAEAQGDVEPRSDAT
jgi:Thymidylate synthase